MKGDGRVYKRGHRWWIEYWVRGRQFRESSGRTEAEAKRKLKARLREVCGGRFIGPQEEKLTVEELLDGLILHLKTKGARAVPSFVSHMKPVREYFSLTRAVDLTTQRVEQFVQARLAEGKAPATINREVGALSQAFNLARKQGRLVRVPYLPKLREDNARQGFFERGDFEAVTANLPDPIADIARFAYQSGWRMGEILSLKWDAVDLAAGEVRLRTSKNGHGRVLPLAGALAELLERRRTLREIKSADGVSHLTDYVFHRQGRPIVDFKKAWSKACGGARVPGKLFHDLRRTAVRNMIRAGVPQSVAMSITGHRTASMFLRYNITSGEDIREALRKTQEHLQAQSTVRRVAEMRSNEPRQNPEHFNTTYVQNHPGTTRIEQ